MRKNESHNCWILILYDFGKKIMQVTDVLRLFENRLKYLCVVAEVRFVDRCDAALVAVLCLGAVTGSPAFLPACPSFKTCWGARALLPHPQLSHSHIHIVCYLPWYALAASTPLDKNIRMQNIINTKRI